MNTAIRDEMMLTDTFAPLFYLLLGAFAGLALPRVWSRVRGSRQNKPIIRQRPAAGPRYVMPTHHPEDERLWEAVTAREREIARLVADGKRNAEIAEMLEISTYTVETHLKRVYAKLRISSRTELARFLHQQEE